MGEKIETVDEYISSFPAETQAVLKKVRQAIREVLPDAEEVISYQIPAFKIGGKYVIYFAGFAKHISVYPIPHGDAALAKEIAPYVAGKGTVRFSLDKPIPYDLIKKLAKALKKARGM